MSFRTAVSLTYDDAIPGHIDRVAPALEAHGFRGTFYTPVHADFIRQWDEWALLAGRGHELGNHTLFHPCRRAVTPSDWIKDYMNLRNYDPDRWCAEVDLANALLDRAEGRTGRTFGNTCHHHILGSEKDPTYLEDLVLPRFLAARGTAQDLDYSINPQHADLRNLGTLACDSFTLEEILPALERCIEKGHWMILTFHHIEEERDRLAFPREEHDALLEFCEEQDGLWVAPVRDVVQAL